RERDGAEFAQLESQKVPSRPGGPGHLQTLTGVARPPPRCPPPLYLFVRGMPPS
ncbi:hypothetical protein CRG98_037710, partial [Punica granatum]